MKILNRFPLLVSVLFVASLAFSPPVHAQHGPDLTPFADRISVEVTAEYAPKTTGCNEAKTKARIVQCERWAAAIDEIYAMSDSLNPRVSGYIKLASNPCTGHIEKRLKVLSRELRALLPGIHDRGRRARLRVVLREMGQPFGAIHC